MGSFPETCNDPKPLPCLRQKAVISLPCLRKETSFMDNVSFSLAYRINQFFFHGIRFFGKEKVVRYRNCKLANRQPSPSFKDFCFEKTPYSRRCSEIVQGITPPVCPLLCFCVKLP